MARISISPDEKMVCYGHMLGHKFKEPGHAMCVADFDVNKLKMTNHKIIANKEYKPAWYAYPRWTRDGKRDMATPAIVPDGLVIRTESHILCIQ